MRGISPIVSRTTLHWPCSLRSGSRARGNYDRLGAGVPTRLDYPDAWFIGLPGKNSCSYEEQKFWIRVFIFLEFPFFEGYLASGVSSGVRSHSF